MRLHVKSIILIMFGLILFIPNAFAANSVERLDGASRYQVAVNVSEKGWNSADTVIVANGNAYADVLAASPLAYLHNAPILLTENNKLTGPTRDRIKQLGAKKVIIIGGDISVQRNVEHEINKLVGSVERIGGASRYQVAENIAGKLPNQSKAVIANGTAYADSLAIASYAARNKIPILLTTSGAIPQPTLDAMRNKGTSSTIVVGGEISVEKSVYDQLPSPTRIGGASRFEVASNIADKYYSSSKESFISNGYAYADALSGSVLAAKQNRPMLFTDAKTLPEKTKDVIGLKNINSFTVLGGTISVQTNVMNQLNNAGKIIFIDPGHGGSDPGAIGYSGIKEKDVNLAISKKVVKKLDGAGEFTIASRTGDTYPTLDDRVEKANAANANIFISIHANSSDNNNVVGSDTFYYNGSASSKRLAQELQARIPKAMETRDRGISEGNWIKVIDKSNMPAVLAETGFVSNSSDASKLNDPYYQDRVAQAIYDAIKAYYK
ncbi:N-acetylmuramoyl-L-alanine amidase [Bacillus gobiensis]|uniref:N-acetylmuramoyl-L-alanine amidase n=1 Tax=Bacillus gobiensis TaxID=1441095 RepID=UPI003D1CA0E9